ncbi:GNAT family N-acetyltransferase [Leifsonia poae]|uniref:N-acetyltransferase domain-containing protein n=1 Tax=Leifsonia poae TaxID=110933 RepID=A0A9W6LZZ0_9MICO|nr:GNAT family protein [Leifsonia poae]GLJ76202.1 hypothetical protein GCM10017584_17760 [Leifsonia poae]
MEIELRELVLPRDRDRVIDFLSANAWPFHSAATLSAAAAAGRLDAGLYSPPGAAAWWIAVPHDAHAGIVSVDELDDGSPMLDLRLATIHRGRGIGRRALGLATSRVFESDPAVRRIEGTTRADNLGMQRVFTACGYVQEARYREAWPVAGGDFTDSLGYAILRREWEAARGSGSSAP